MCKIDDYKIFRKGNKYVVGGLNLLFINEIYIKWELFFIFSISKDFLCILKGVKIKIVFFGKNLLISIY